ncbi:MAG: hypothetical protein PQJ59_05485 [Spirochaetales bacterium]|nr:hypothetical protein [Spirochaetales bacterium]
MRGVKVFSGLLILPALCRVGGCELGLFQFTGSQAAILSFIYQGITMMAAVVFLFHLLGKGSMPEDLVKGIHLGYLCLLVLFSLETVHHRFHFLLLFIMLVLIAFYYGYLYRSLIILSLVIVLIMNILYYRERGDLTMGLTTSFFIALYFFVFYLSIKSRDETYRAMQEKIEGLKENISQKDRDIKKLERPQFMENPNLTKSEKKLLNTMRLLKTTNTKVLAGYMGKAVSTIGNRIYLVRQKLEMKSRTELYAYVLLSIPEPDPVL